jgi:hypothetical protein
MRKNRESLLRASAIALLMSAPLTVQPARAAIDPSCKPVLDAMRKQLATPTHSYVTEVAKFRGNKPVSSESIHTGSVSYIQVNGKWRRSPITVEDLRKQQEENLRTAKSMACRYLRDEAVSGEAAAVYRSQAENQDVKSDSTVWVSKRTGLPLRSENDLDTGDADQQHLSIRYDYANVQPPTGVK